MQESRSTCLPCKINSVLICLFELIDGAGARCLTEAKTSQNVVLSALERYCKTRYPEDTFRYGKILLKLMGLRGVNAADLEFLFFSKILHHVSIGGVIRNRLVRNIASPGGSFREMAF